MRSPKPGPGEAEYAQLSAFDEQPGEQRVHTDPVAAERVPYLVICPAMTVPAYRRRVVGDLVSGRQDADEHLVVASGSGRRPRIESLIEGTDQIDGLTTKRHVRTSADAPDLHRSVVL